MRVLTIRFLSLFLCLALIATSLSFAQAAGTQAPKAVDPGMLRALEKAAEAVQASFDKNGLKDVLRLPTLMKEAGITYNASLLATTDPRVLRGKDQRSMHVLRGIYGMDLLYSLAFGKRIDAIVTVMVGIDETLGSSPSAKWKTALNAGDIEAIAEVGVKYFSKLAQEYRADSLKAQQMGGTLFGFGLETFYLYAKTGLAVGVTNDFAGILQRNIPLLAIIKDIIDSTSTMPEDTIHARLDAVLDTRSEVVEGVLDILQRSKGKLTEADLRAILAIVEKPRATFLALGK